eukprot:TRINITY_DN42226_c0_g1_i1.p1 TRINITY_DN42226_c0_g1~~TRINITY_DN42226_c0_g1_i1.p1  ORF type:complete len:482 (+),score=76.90 TRINITY_DN42226_c0_g1_i1:153-1598(+)
MYTNAIGSNQGYLSNDSSPRRRQRRRPRQIPEEEFSKSRLQHGKYSFRISREMKGKGRGKGKGSGKKWVRKQSQPGECQDASPTCIPPLDVVPETVKHQAEQVPQCVTTGCCRETWNGQPGQTCCRTCAGSDGAVHGPDCNRKWKVQQQQKAEAAQTVPSPRSCRLVDHLLSSAVQLPLPADEVTEEPKRLSAEEVERVFRDNVPGVEKFLYRNQHGNYSMNYLKLAYENGVHKFRGTDLENHFTWLMRKVVHYAEEQKPGCRGYLQEVAEAFMDCQDIQARAIEHVGFQIAGVTLDFRGLLVQLIDEYKAMAMKFLVTTEIDGRGGPDDWCNDPVHFENRVVADIGLDIGINAADVRRAVLDEHKERNDPFGEEEKQSLKRKFKGFFELDIMLRSFVNEVNSFSESSPKDSLAKLFLDWVSEKMPEKHVVFDQETLANIDIDPVFGKAVLEVVFLGDTQSQEEFRGQRIKDLLPASKQLP